MILYLNIIWKFLSVRWFCQSLVPLHHQHIDVSKGPAQQQIWYNFDFTSCENIGSMLKEWIQWPQWGERACYYLSLNAAQSFTPSMSNFIRTVGSLVQVLFFAFGSSLFATVSNTYLLRCRTFTVIFESSSVFMLSFTIPAPHSCRNLYLKHTYHVSGLNRAINNL